MKLVFSDEVVEKGVLKFLTERLSFNIENRQNDTE